MTLVSCRWKVNVQVGEGVLHSRKAAGSLVVPAPSRSCCVTYSSRLCVIDIHEVHESAPCIFSRDGLFTGCLKTMTLANDIAAFV